MSSLQGNTHQVVLHVLHKACNWQHVPTHHASLQQSSSLITSQFPILDSAVSVVCAAGVSPCSWCVLALAAPVCSSSGLWVGESGGNWGLTKQANCTCDYDQFILAMQ